MRCSGKVSRIARPSARPRKFDKKKTLPIVYGFGDPECRSTASHQTHSQTKMPCYRGSPSIVAAQGAAPETAIQHMVPASAVTYASPAPVIEYVAQAPADTDTTPESMTEYVAPAPAPAVYYATPAPLIEFATPSPVIEYSALASSVTCFTHSPQSLLAHTNGSCYHWCHR